MARLIEDIKNNEDDKSFIQWLAVNNVMIESSKFGYSKISHVGYLLFIHTGMTWRDYLQEQIEEQIQNLPHNFLDEVFP